MNKALWGIALIGILILAGLKVYDWIERAESERFEQREQMVRKIAEDRAAQGQRVIDAGSAVRTDAITREIESMQHGRNLDSLLQR